jgi:GT2 family glycosyltransferase
LSKIWLSVVMPTYNGSRYVGAALASIAAQADTGLEVVVVDDQSSDDTLTIVRSFADRLNLSILEGERTGNWVATSNLGLAHAQGSHVSFLHQDDLWLPGRLDRLRGLLARYPDAAMIFPAARYIDQRGVAVGRWTAPFRAETAIIRSDELIERLLVQNFICVAAPAFRRQEALATGGLDETLWYTADWDLWLRLASLGPSVYSARPDVAFRIHPESQTVRRSRATGDFLAQLERVTERHLQQWRPAPQVLKQVAAAAAASNAINAMLAGVAHGDRSYVWPACRRLRPVGLAGARRLLRDTRLPQRVSARLRARLRGISWAPAQ